MPKFELMKGPTKQESSQDAQGMTIDLMIKDEKKSVELNKGEVKQEKCQETGDVLVEMKRYSDDVYSIWFHKEMLQVTAHFLNFE